jgi:uracil-DNA glycosylase
MAAQDLLDHLRESRAVGCQRCHLHKGRNFLVFGAGNAEADIVLVGEGPGEDENRRGEPFVGPAGQLLDGFLRRQGLAREDIYITNIVKCRPPNNREPDSDEVAACLPLLHVQLRIIRPKVIVALGRVAGERLARITGPVGMLRNSTLTYYGPAASGLECPLVVTYHPSYVLRCQTRDRDAAKEAAGSIHTDLTAAVELARRNEP